MMGFGLTRFAAALLNSLSLEQVEDMAEEGSLRLELRL